MQAKTSISELIDRYIQYKRSLGFAYEKSSVTSLTRMGRFLEERRTPDGEIASQETVLDWIENGGSDHPKTRAYRAIHIRLFCLYLFNRGYDAYVLPADLVPQASRDFIPYVFTHDEIKAVIGAIDQLGPARSSPHRGLIYSAMVRILYGCGLRLGELRRLKVEDVDLAEGVITVRNSKNDDSRYVPMSESLREHLATYLSEGPADESNPGSYFFPSPYGGGIYDGSIILKTFKRCCAEVGIENRKGELPRIHDLRHSFAVHSLMQAAEAGTPAHVFLPTLATFMGHKHIVHTEYYLHLTAEGQDAMIDKLAAAYGDKIYKEVL